MNLGECGRAGDVSMSDDPIKNAIDGLLLEASVAVAKLDWSTVDSLADAALKLDPENVDALKFRSLVTDRERAPASADGSSEATIPVASRPSPLQRTGRKPTRRQPP